MNTNVLKRSSITGLVLAAALPVSCGSGGSDANDPDPVGVAEQAIVGGTSADLGTQEFYGLVTLNGGCSGKAISPRFIISASHCGNQSSVTFLGVTYPVEATDRNPGYPTRQSLDIELIRTAHPLLNRDGSVWSPGFNFFLGTASDLVGKELLCFGAGLTQDSSSGFSGTFGVWNRAIVRVGGFHVNAGDTSNAAWLDLTKDNNQGFLAPGDSGGPCFLRGGIGDPTLYVSLTKANGLLPPSTSAGVVLAMRPELVQWAVGDAENFLINTPDDPTCLAGIRNGSACCASQCGTCGGGGCGSRPGGKHSCCVGTISGDNVSCEDHMAPCVIHP